MEKEKEREEDVTLFIFNSIVRRTHCARTKNILLEWNMTFRKTVNIIQKKCAVLPNFIKCTIPFSEAMKAMNVFPCVILFHIHHTKLCQSLI